MATILFLMLASVVGFLVLIVYLVNARPSGQPAGAPKSPPGTPLEQAPAGASAQKQEENPSSPARLPGAGQGGAEPRQPGSAEQDQEHPPGDPP